jgi:2'-deoxynucleoside 5'-phosphate N-hydrolase
MRIYLACTVRGDRGGVAAGRAICERLRRHGHDVLTAHLLDDNVETAESQLTEEAVFRRDLDWLSSCDVLVAEASGSSFGVGFEVGYVLAGADRTGQRVVLLYDRARTSNVSRLVVGNVHPRCETLAYNSVDELLAFIDQRFAPA